MRRLRVELPDIDFIEFVQLSRLISEAIHPLPEQSEGLSCIVGKRVQITAPQTTVEGTTPRFSPLPNSGSKQVEIEPIVVNPSIGVSEFPPVDALNGETQDMTDSTRQCHQLEQHVQTIEHESSSAEKVTRAADDPESRPSLVFPLTDSDRTAMALVLPSLPKLYGTMSEAEIDAFIQAFRSLSDRPLWEPVIQAGEESFSKKDKRMSAWLVQQRGIKKAVDEGQLRAITPNRTPTRSLQIGDLFLREDAKQYLTGCGFDVTPKEVRPANSERPSLGTDSPPHSSDDASPKEGGQTKTHESEGINTACAVSEDPITAPGTGSNDQHLPEPAGAPDSAPLAQEKPKSNRPTGRKNELTAPIVAAQSRCKDPTDTHEVWLAFRKLVDEKVEPLRSVSQDDDVNWQDKSGKYRTLSYEAFRKRLNTVKNRQ